VRFVRLDHVRVSCFDIRSVKGTASNSESQGPRPGRPARGTRSGRPLLVAFDLLGRRWALRVLWELREEALGFRELQRRCGDMSSSVLSDRLAELGGAGIVEAGEDGYALSVHGRDLLAALEPLSRWADAWSRATRPASSAAGRARTRGTSRS
jgi:DNA-binding HxlR family transcriptional regulator